MASAGTKIISPFYDMIAKTKVTFSLKYFSQYFEWDSDLACTVNVLDDMVFKTKIKELKTVVSLENIAGNISCENVTEMTSPFCLDTITM